MRDRIFTSIQNKTRLSKMKEAVIVTASSDEFFPWLLNLIGSIQNNFPDHPPIAVYDLGLKKSFVKELRAIKDVEVFMVPPFTPFWRSCYTWKLYALKNAPAKIIFYIDAGCEVLKPLDEIFRIIDKEGYFCIDQRYCGEDSYLKEIIPEDFARRLGIKNLKEFCGDKLYFCAGIFGYKRGTRYEDYVSEVFDLAREGWSIGWSLCEMHRNIGRDKTDVIRDCRLFRHDQTVLNAVFYKHLNNLKLHDNTKYADLNRYSHPEQLIWASRRTNRTLKYLSRIIYSNNRIFARFFHGLYCLFLMNKYKIKNTAISAK